MAYFSTEELSRQNVFVLLSEPYFGDIDPMSAHDTYYLFHHMNDEEAFHLLLVFLQVRCDPTLIAAWLQYGLRMPPCSSSLLCIRLSTAFCMVPLSVSEC